MQRADPETVKAKVLEICQEFKLSKLGIESNTFQELYVDDIKKYLAANKVSIIIEPIKHTADKQLRINSIHGPIVNHVYFREDWEEQYSLLIQQLLNFPQGKHDDGPDALEGLLSMYGTTKEPRIRWL